MEPKNGVRLNPLRPTNASTTFPCPARCTLGLQFALYQLQARGLKKKTSMTIAQRTPPRVEAQHPPPPDTLRYCLAISPEHQPKDVTSVRMRPNAWRSRVGCTVAKYPQLCATHMTLQSLSNAKQGLETRITEWIQHETIQTSRAGVSVL